MNAPRLFDAGRRRRAATAAARLPAGADPLRALVADRLLERLGDVRRTFVSALVLDDRGQDWVPALAAACQEPARLVTMALVPRAAGSGQSGQWVVGEPEVLPFAASSFGLALAVGGLHARDDLPGVLIQLRRSLAPNGLLLAALAGGDTMAELRWALTQAELDLEGGAANRIAPFADVRSVGALLQRAGLGEPIVDVERLTLTYTEPRRLFADLRGMGERGILAGPVRPLSRAVVARAVDLYRERFADAEGRVPATVDLITLAAWAPAAAVPRAAG